MTAALALSPTEAELVRTILRTHLPAGVRVGVFGSRARGTAKPWSDLDLALDAPRPLGLAVLAQLAEAFDESALPWKVDVLERNSLDTRFAAIVAADWTELLQT